MMDEHISQNVGIVNWIWRKQWPWYSWKRKQALDKIGSPHRTEDVR